MSESKTQPITHLELLRDFYQSFRFSQGKVHIQFELFKGLKQFYQESGIAFDGALRSESLKARVATMNIPKSHKGNYSADVAYTVEWENFINAAGSQKFYRPRTALYRGLLIDTIDADLNYQRSERTLSGSDVHKSYFRQYV